MEQEQIAGNSFMEGFKQDTSDFALKNTQLRFGYNIRVINHEGSNFVVSNITGTEQAFQLTSGFVPVGAKEHNNVLYLVCWNDTTKEVEVGSYPSPPYSGGSDNNQYRPFNNYNSGAFRTSNFGIATQPIVDVTIQDDFDRSVNVIFTLKEPATGHIPRIVNSKFKVTADTAGNNVYTILDNRPGNANSNTYTSSSVEKETRLIVASDKILSVNLGGVQSGGKLKPGNYVYVFHYMTEDFNMSSVVGQTSICQIFHGTSAETIRGGDETQETEKRIQIDLSNVDTDFKYFKVYALYSAGQEGLFQQYLEFTQPLTITGENMSFIHSGFETVSEVSQDTINIEYGNISGVDTITQINGYLLLGGIKEFSYSIENFKRYAQAVKPQLGIKTLSVSGTGGYMNPQNTHDYMGYFGGESYALAMVFVLPGGALSPAFPTKGIIMTGGYSGGPTVTYTNPTNPENGIVTFPGSNWYLPYDGNQIQVKHLKMNISSTSLIANGLTQEVIDYVKESSIGFFFVRGNRIPSLIAQGAIIPTFKAPTTDWLNTDADGDNTYWHDNLSQIDNTTYFKYLPLLDSMTEAYINISRNDDGSEGAYDYNVVDANNNLQDGYMPIFIQDTQTQSRGEILYSTGSSYLRHWAMLSGEALLNEPEYVTTLNRENISLQQLAIINSLVKGEITPKLTMYDGDSSVRTGLLYDFSTFTRYTSNIVKTIKKINYVTGASFITGTDFVSRIKASLWNGAHNSRQFFNCVDLEYNSFFGIEMDTTNGQLNDATKGIGNPVGGNTRITSYGNITHQNFGITAGPNYNNFNKTIPASFLVNIYPSGGVALGSNLYPTIDGVAYRQVSKRFTWDDVVAATTVDVFGGDNYISKVSRKLNQSPYRNPAEIISDKSLRSNINAGIVLSWYQESKYNLNLRQPDKFDDSELESRSFYPYQSRGDFNAYRKYRYPETVISSKGYSETSTPKSFFPVPLTTPFLENEFFSRIYASDKHVPNVFRNGFRRITNNFQDYTSSLGRIVRLFNHRNKMMIVFENGIGLGTINERIQTGSDVAGAIFIESKDILPPNIGFATQEIGSQQFYSMVQSPSAVYGYDAIRGKFWQLRDTFRVISDDGFSTFLLKNPSSNLRAGYDFENNEVVFTSDNWTLCFKEGLEKFTSFYSFRPSFYARKGKDFYSFSSNFFHRHNVSSTFNIYGSSVDSIVEVVLNDKIGVTKVLDYIELISNEVAPTKVEIFTYNQTTEKLQVLNTASMNQYVNIPFGDGVFTKVARINYRNKKYVIKLPLVKVYNGGSLKDKWGIKGRMVNKYFIIRLTYHPDKLLQLAAILSNYRFSSE